MDYTDLYDFKTGSGIVVPSDADVKEGIETKFKQIFGSDLDVTPTTPVGRLIEALTVLVKSALGVSAQSANQFNVNFATGIYLDSLAQIYSMSRYAGKKTVVRVRLQFTSNRVTVPAGSMVMSEGGDTFVIDGDISPDETLYDGTYWYGEGTATADSFGPIPADEGTVNRVQNSILGWVGVTNYAPIQIGSDIETDEAFRKRIKESRPIGVGFQTHLIALLQKLKNVQSVCVLENNNSVVETQNGVPIDGHSIYVCVLAVDSEEVNYEIASAIQRVKPAGTGMVNDLDCGADLKAVEVTSSEGVLFTGMIYFYHPVIDSISITVDVRKNQYAGNDIETDVKNAIIDYVTDVNIGETIYNTVLANAIMSALPAVSVLSITMTSSVSDQEDVLNLSTFAYVKAMVDAANIKVNVVS